MNQHGSAGSKIHPMPQLFPFLLPKHWYQRSQLLKYKQWTRSNESNTGSVTKESLKQCPPEETWFPICPSLLRQEFISLSSLWSFTPPPSLISCKQLLGYLSRAPIKGCHSGFQCPGANHIRAPAHVQPLLCCSSPVMLITFKYFHRWPISCLGREKLQERELMFEEQKLTSSYVNANKRQNHWIRKMS